MIRTYLKIALVALAVAAPGVSQGQTSFVWSGPYAGLNLGYGSADMVTSNGAGSSDGSEVTAFLGFNWLRGDLVLGTEADVTLNIGSDYVFGGPVPVGTTNAAVDWMSTIRGRVGTVKDGTLVYATAGLSYSDTVSNGRSYDWGYVIGAGFERPISWRFTWRAEALYHGYSPNRVSATRAELDNAFSVRLGVARQF